MKKNRVSTERVEWKENVANPQNVVKTLSAFANDFQYLDQPHPDAAVDDIDPMAFKEFLKKLTLPHPLAKYLEPGIRFRGDVQDLVTFPPGRTDRAVPRNFTLLLFGEEPHRFFRGAHTIFSVYKGTDRASFRSQRFVLHGPIPVLIRNIMARLQLYMGMDIDKNEDMVNGRPNRRRFSEYAVQEAIVNAFVHRDYHSFDPVRITVFEDRIEVLSPGGLNTPADIEEVRKGNIYTSWRNPSLAWFMVELGFAQNEGKGIRAIVEHTKNIAGKEPEFDVSNHWFRVDIPAFNPLLDSFEETEGLEFDIKIELPTLRSDFDELKELLTGLYPKLETDLNTVDECLNEVVGDSPKEKFNKPLNHLRRLLKSMADKGSEYNKLVVSISKGGKTAGQLARTYNKFARWLALPRVPDK